MAFIISQIHSALSAIGKVHSFIGAQQSFESLMKLLKSLMRAIMQPSTSPGLFKDQPLIDVPTRMIKVNDPYHTAQNQYFYLIQE